ncbi:MAG: NAD(P)/FAD-dependent oxidoreductase [Fibrobacterota bacterium]
MKIVIIGANFAGQQAFKKLSHLTKYHEIHILEKESHATMIPSLPDVAAGKIAPSCIRADLRSLFNKKNVFYHQAEVTTVDFTHRTIITTQQKYSYDYLILAAGSRAQILPLNTGDIPFHTLISLNDAQTIQKKLELYCKKEGEKNIIIIGGGYTGCELAGAFAVTHRNRDVKITIITLDDTIIPFLTSKERARIEKELEKRGVTLLCNNSVEKVTGNTLCTVDGQTFESPFVCSAVGTAVSIGNFPGNTPEKSRAPLPITGTLQHRDFPEVFITGDMADLRDKKGNKLRNSVNFSKMSGAHAGKNLAAQITERKLRPFIPRDLGWVIPVGKTSVGRLFGTIPVWGKPGVLLHYFMSGVQNFSIKNFFAFCKITLRELVS